VKFEAGLTVTKLVTMLELRGSKFDTSIAYDPMDPADNRVSNFFGN